MCCLKSVPQSLQLKVAILGVNNGFELWSFLKLVLRAASSSLSFNPKSKDELYHRPTSTELPGVLTEVETYKNMFSFVSFNFYASS